MAKHIKPSPVADPLHGLGDHGRALWNLITSQYEIRDAGGIEMLRQCCMASDRVAELKAAIDVDGAIVKTRSGMREHPALKAQLALRSFITRTLLRLGLSVEALQSHSGRPARGFGWQGE